MVERARLAFSVKKLQKINHERGGAESGQGSLTSYVSENQERCLVMTSINIKKPMKITFINKAALKIT